MTMTTSAKVTVTVELFGLGTWGPECKIEQVVSQATEAAIYRLRGKLGSDVRIIGTPTVEAVTSKIGGK